MTDKQYDLIVIGSGTAAAAIAPKGRQHGWSVAVIDYRPYGGTCALRGCDPKKVLLAAAEAVQWSQRLTGRGIDPAGQCINWPQLMKFKHTFTDPVPARQEGWMQHLGIDTYHDKARFTGPTTLQVGADVLESNRIVIATGATPATLGIPGEEHLINSTEFLDLEALPKRILFVGGGYISMEFANLAARAGSQVTIVQRGAHVLPEFDPDLADVAAKAAGDAGITLMLNTTVKRICANLHGFTVDVTNGATTGHAEVDLVVHGAGRVADLADLDLASAGVEHSPTGVTVNEYLQSVSNPSVYAAGDASDTAGLPLTPVSSVEGRTVAANLIHGNTHTPDYTATPTVAFTLPPLAAVGITQAQAQSQGLNVEINSQDTADWFSNRRLGESHAASKVITDPASGKILGAHLLGPSAEEIINIFALAIRHGLTAADLKDTIYAYPTHSSDISYLI